MLIEVLLAICLIMIFVLIGAVFYLVMVFRKLEQEVSLLKSATADKTSSAPEGPSTATKPTIPQRKHINPIGIIFAIVVCVSLIYLIAYKTDTTRSAPSASSTQAASPSTSYTVATTEPIATTEPSPLPRSLPTTGTIGTRSGEDTCSTLTVHASGTKNCVVKLKDDSGHVVISFFVRAGASCTVNVPGKRLHAYFAEGTAWYGWKDYFGEDTVYSMDEDELDFCEYNYEYKLYMVSNGNLTLSDIDPEDF